MAEKEVSEVEHGVLEEGAKLELDSNSAEILASNGGTELKILKKINEFYQRRINEVERVEGDLEVKFETCLCFSPNSRLKFTQ